MKEKQVGPNENDYLKDFLCLGEFFDKWRSSCEVIFVKDNCGWVRNERCLECCFMKEKQVGPN